MPKSERSFEVEVAPSVMRWAIGSSGWDPGELAERLKVSEDTLDAWQSGDSLPTLSQLESLASRLKRPVTALLLPSPPRESPSPPDFRMLPGRTGRFERDTVFAIRKARRKQEASRGLMRNIGAQLPPRVEHASRSDDPAEIARRWRGELGVTERVQKKWKDQSDAFRRLRHAIEGRNVLVFQMKMPIKDARGFALVDEMPATIVVSSSDDPGAKLFTLLHEFGHILINQSGIDMGGQSFGERREPPVEKWCNEFASEFLLPKEIFLRELGGALRGGYDEEKARSISKQYRVSKLMIITKMLNSGAIDRGSYSRIRGELEAKGAIEKGRGFPVPPETRCLNENGERFVSLVRDNIKSGEIGYYDAVDLLSVKVKIVDKVLGKATG
jgi:Zn-dependent peptidase ImmA (M78 family)/transcriptional regulator with XRE-family HTH domain